MIDRATKLTVVQGILAAATLLGFLSFMVRSPKVGWSFRAIAACTAVGYIAVDRERERIESGEAMLDEVAVQLAILEAQQQDFDHKVEAETKRIEEAYLARVQELNGERELIEAERAEIEQLKLTFRTELEAEKQQAEQNIRAEWERLETIANELNAKAQIQEVQLRQEREEHQLELRQLQINLFDRERAVALAEANIKLRMEELELEYARKFAEAKQAVLANHKQLYEELQHEQEKVLVAQQLLDDEFNKKTLELQAALQEAQNELRAQQMRMEEEEAVHQQRVEQLYAEKEVELELARQEAIAVLQQEWNVKEAEANAFIDSLLSQIEGYRMQLQEFLVAQDFPDHKGYAAYIGNLVLKEIREYEGILVEPHDCMSLPGSQEKPTVVVWLRRGDGVRPESIFGLKGAIAARVQRTDITMRLDANGFVAIGFGDVDGVISTPTGDVEEVASRNAREPVTITEPTEEQLADAFDASSMYFVAGPTGIGKSTLVNNLLSRAAASLGDRVEIVINDMKFPDPDTTWRILGKEVTPQYCDFQNDECMVGAQDMAAHFLARKQKRLQDHRSKRPISRFKKSLWVVDEAPTLIDAYKAEVSAALKMSVRVARGLDGKVCIIGQTPRCKDYNFKIPDMHNFTRFYLGADFATIGLKEISVAPRIKARLATEIHLRQKLAEEQIARGEVLPNGKPPAMFFALVATQSSQVFLMTMPPPNAYDNWEAKKEEGYQPVDDSEITPVSREQLRDLMAKAAAEEGEELPAPVQQPTPAASPMPAIDLDSLNPLQRAIVSYCLQNRGTEFRFSDFNAKNDAIRKIVNAIAETQEAGDRATLIAANAKGSKSKRQPRTVSKAGLIKEACFQLVTEHKIGSISPDGKRYGIQ